MTARDNNDDSPSSSLRSPTALSMISRRSLIAMGAGYLSASSLASRVHAASPTAMPPPPTTTTTTTSVKPIADLPMIRLRLPQGGFGREYVAIQLKVQGQGPFDFMLDTGLTTEFITPHLQQQLGIGKGGAERGASKISGLAAGGGTHARDLIQLTGASLYCGDGETEIPLPPLSAVVTDFPQEHIDPAHDPVEGMLGMELLSQFDVDFDFAAGRLRLWKPGTAQTAATAVGMVAIPAVVINETGLIGIRATAPGRSQPILAFLDCGSTFSAVNWAATPYLDMPPKDSPAYAKGPFVAAMGIDGRPLQLPTYSQQFSFTGDLVKDQATGRPIGFAPPPANWKPWDKTLVTVGDLPAFESVLGDGKTPYRGPAALMGLDVLAQRRVILETGTAGQTRQRRVFVSSS